MAEQDGERHPFAGLRIELIGTFHSRDFAVTLRRGSVGRVLRGYYIGNSVIYHVDFGEQGVHTIPHTWAEGMRRAATLVRVISPLEELARVAD